MSNVFGPGAAPKSLLGRYRVLAPNANIKVSPLCLGTMSFGQAGVKVQGETTREEAFAVMDTFYQQGGNFFDTASGYQHGQSEEWVGQWMEERGVRDEIVLATKYTMPFNLNNKGAIQANYQGNGSKSLKLSLAASLRKLQTDYVDILYVHWWDFATSIPELMGALHHLVAAGKVLYLGISDTPAWIVSKANQYARDHALTPFVLYQGRWSAATRDFERDILPMCKDEGMGLAPWGPLNQGRFQTKAEFARREGTDEGRRPPSQQDKDISAKLEAVADKKSCTIQQVALAYIQQKAAYVFPIVGCRTVKHIQGSIDSLNLELTEEEIAEVERAYPFDHGFPHTMLSGSSFEPEAPSRNVNGPQDVSLNKIGGSTFDWVGQPTAIRPPSGN
jgi:aryl-alcohol dehydrogenase-like predicted oxidoreductase